MRQLLFNSRIIQAVEIIFADAYVVRIGEISSQEKSGGKKKFPDMKDALEEERGDLEPVGRRPRRCRRLGGVESIDRNVREGTYVAPEGMSNEKLSDWVR